MEGLSKGVREMKLLKIGSAVLLIGLVAVALAAPIGPMPGFLIGGSASSVPPSWGDTLAVEEILLQVGEGPVGRTVIIWTVQIDGDLYVTGQKDSGWTRGIGSGGPVRVQMEGNLYELAATPVTEGQADVLAAWITKYERKYPDIVAGPSPEERATTAAVFRLTARS
jgi:hypothetical protein